MSAAVSFATDTTSRQRPASARNLVVSLVVILVPVLLGSCSVPGLAPATPAKASDQDPSVAWSSCVEAPSGCGYPDASNTGVPPGTKLTRVPQELTEGQGWRYDDRGWIEVYGDGTVLAGISTRVGLSISGSNVVVRDSRIVTTGLFGVAVRHAADVTIQDSEITGAAVQGQERLLVAIKDIYADSIGLRILRNDISGAATGVQLEAGLVEGNYIHGLAFAPGDHVNGMTSNGGTSQLTIRHNTVLNSHDQTDAISLFQDFGPQRNRRIEDNLVAGGGYTIYGGANPGLESHTALISVVGNRISRLYFPNGGLFGPGAAWFEGNGNVWVDNVWDDTGEPVPPP